MISTRLPTVALQCASRFFTPPCGDFTPPCDDFTPPCDDWMPSLVEYLRLSYTRNAPRCQRWWSIPRYALYTSPPFALAKGFDSMLRDDLYETSCGRLCETPCGRRWHRYCRKSIS
ncbi:MAG TPA: hypothetical protein G4N92_03335 [Anaerolineae bacterium]|nr:hypothetical protein [Anaerolineae bacterium]